MCRLGALEHGADHRHALKKVKAGKFTAEDYGIFSLMKHKGLLGPRRSAPSRRRSRLTSSPRSRRGEADDPFDGKFTVKVDDSQPKVDSEVKARRRHNEARPWSRFQKGVHSAATPALVRPPAQHRQAPATCLPTTPSR